MPKMIAVAGVLLVATMLGALSTVAATAAPKETWSQKRARCTAEARASSMQDRGRAFRLRYRACMATFLRPAAR